MDMPKVIWASEMGHWIEQPSPTWLQTYANNPESPLKQYHLAPQWTPVSEAPKEQDEYLVTDGTNWKELVLFDGEQWIEFGKIITHYMRVPEVK